MSFEMRRAVFSLVGRVRPILIPCLILGAFVLWGMFELRATEDRVAAVARVLAGSGPRSGIDADLAVDLSEGFEARIRDYLLRHPKVLREALDPRRLARLALEAKGDQLLDEAGFPVVESSDGQTEPLVLVEFFDYRCGYCQRFFPAIEQALDRASRGEGPNLRFVAVEFPILGPDSERVARLALAVRALDAELYVEVHSDLMGPDGPQDYSETGLRKWAEGRAWAVGLDLDALFESGLSSPTVDESLEAARMWAAEIEVTGTPFFGVRGPGGWMFDPESAASPETFARLLERASGSS
ncbi:MAG: DsbA family protein [Proteobacteria bacterium]|nr:DsbA family protein [Pseudomonadota bacterium]